MDKIPFMDTLPTSLKELYNTLTELSFKKDDMSNYRIVRTLIDITPSLQITNTEFTYDTIQHIRILETFLETMRTHNIPLTDMLKRLSIALKTGHKIEYTMPHSTSQIHIMTAHKSKGLEFNTVFIPHLQSNIWDKKDKERGMYLPKTLINSDVNKNIITQEERRRLLFVAMTRAKKELYMSNYKHKTDETSKVDSSLLYLLETNVPTNTDTITPSDDIYTSVLKPINTHQNDATIDDYMRHIATNFVWSASSLTLFIDDPDAFYKQYMIGIPNDYTTKAMYGTAVHKALEGFLRYVKEHNIVPDYHYLEGLFIQEIHHIPFTDADKEHYIYMGKEALQHYYTTHKDMFPGTYLLEYNFKKQCYKDIYIKGKADVIRINSDKTASLIDYKTGSKKVGKTKGRSNWRQLVFYDILFRGDLKAYTLKEIGIEYIDDSTKDSGYVPYNVSDDDRNALYKELVDAHQRLLNLDFNKYTSAHNENDEDNNEE